MNSRFLYDLLSLLTQKTVLSLNVDLSADLSLTASENNRAIERIVQCRHWGLFDQSKRLLDVGQMRKYQSTKYEIALKWQPHVT